MGARAELRTKAAQQKAPAPMDVIGDESAQRIHDRRSTIAVQRDAEGPVNSRLKGKERATSEKP